MTLHKWMRTTRWAAAPVLALLVVACGTAAEPPLPTRTPAPTFTPTTESAPPPVEAPPAAQEQPVQPPAQPQTTTQEIQTEGPPPTPAPAQEVAATPPAPPAAAEVVANTTMNVRGGPGTNYNIVGAANQGQRYPVIGKSPDGTWWQINYNGQPGWVFGELVTAQNTQAVAVASNIPQPPPPTATPIPQPTPVPQPQPEQPTPAPQQPAPPANNDNFPFALADTAQCAPNAGNTYFEGFVRRSDNSPLNAVCVHIAFYGPRGTKCSGCDGVGDGKWGFSPFGGPAPAGTFVEIFVVPCEGAMPLGGQTEQTGFGNLTPQSPKWSRAINSSEQCTGITFYQK
ncbi:MAG: SH3 domain-containing protein [Caldilineaceae bacterium]|nr:SH3 domain-containing protein [Caldilineaceae bacterium]